MVEDIKKQRITEVIFWASFFILFMISEIKPELDQNEVFFHSTRIIQLFIAFTWVVYDARIKNENLSILFKMGIIALCIIFVPIYVFRTRGFVAGLKGIGIFIFKFVLLLVVTASVVGVLNIMGITNVSP